MRAADGNDCDVTAACTMLFVSMGAARKVRRAVPKKKTTMFKTSFQIARVWGIPIKVHVSLIVVLLLMAGSVYHLGGWAAFFLALAVGVGVFTSVALHELGHSFVAIRKGCRVREITLLFIGGAAMMERIPSRPRDEFQMAIAGPLVSLVLGLALTFGATRIAAIGAMNIARVVYTVGRLNFILAFFNLIPAFPMDGGRVLRSFLSPRMGRLRATFIASRLGRIIAVILGLFTLLSPDTNWFLVAIAFFIYVAAGNEYRLVQMQEARKQQRAAGWWGMGYGYGTPPPPPSGAEPWDQPDDEHVRISPPPYADGPGEETEIEVEDDRGPFTPFIRKR